MPEATISRRGRLTLPKAVRDALQVGAGDRVRFCIDAHGRVTVEPGTISLDQLIGRVKTAKRAVTLHAMDAVVRSAVARRRAR